MKKIYNARSKENGIIFYSNYYTHLVVESFVDEKGEIQANIAPQMLSDMLCFLDEIESNDTSIVTPKRIIFFDVLFVIVSGFIFKSTWITSATIFFSIFCSFRFFKLMESAFKLKIGSEKNVAKFHAAEHMAINAYTKLQRIPSLEEIKSASRFSQQCGSIIHMRRLLPYILISVCMMFGDFINIFVYLLLIISTAFLVGLMDKFELLKYSQVLFTSKPTDLELKVAIKGLEEFEKMEQIIKQGDFENLFPSDSNYHFFLRYSLLNNKLQL